MTIGSYFFCKRSPIPRSTSLLEASLLLVIVYLASFSGFSYSQVPENTSVAACLAPLDRQPTGAVASQVVEKLHRLAAAPAGREKALADNVAKMVSGLFMAEQRFLEAHAGLAELEKLAAQKQKNASGWLHNNPTGLQSRIRSYRPEQGLQRVTPPNSPLMAEKAAKDAQILREKAAEGDKTAKVLLAFSVKDTTAALEALDKDGHHQVCSSIRRIVDAMAERYLGIPTPANFARRQVENRTREEQISKVLLALGILAAISSSSGDGGTLSESDTESAQRLFRANAENYEKRNYEAQQRGEELPYKGYGIGHHGL